MIKCLRFLLPILCMFFAVGVMAQDVVIASGDSISEIIKSVMALVTNYKSMGGVAAAGAGITIFVQLLKNNILSFLFKSELSKSIKTFTILVLTSILGVLTLKVAGSGWLDASVAGLITSGAAVAIYKAARLFKKK